MEISISSTPKIIFSANPETSDNDIIALPCNEQLCSKISGGQKVSIIEELGATENLKELIEKKSFGGKTGQQVWVQTRGKSGQFKAVCVFGTTSEDTSIDTSEFAANFRAAGLTGGHLSKCCKVLIANPDIDGQKAFTPEQMEGFAAGLADSAYAFTKYITDEKRLSKMSLLKEIIVQHEENQKLNDEANNLNGAVSMVKDLINYPANDLFPQSYADFIVKHLGSLPNIKVRVINVAELEKIGMKMLLGVGQASSNNCCVVAIEYKGNKSSGDNYDIALVGKGITFDSGGLSIKPSNYMMDMKTDMSGSAAVVGAMQSLSANNEPVNVIGLVGLVENSVDGKAQRPGDIVKSLSGKTVEVLNTDAEGRLVLGDLITFAQKEYKAKKVVNIATLTGAITVALGDFYAGLFSNSDELSGSICSAAKETGERVHRFPMGSDYSQMLKSPIADIKNISNTGLAGSITAAEFLKFFVEGDTQWAHIDIAGTAYYDKPYAISHKQHATGFGVRLLYSLVKNHLTK